MRITTRLLHASAPPAADLLRPLCSSSFSLPMVEYALAETEGSSSLGGLGLGRRMGAPTLPFLGSAPTSTQHELLQNFFKNLLNSRDRAETPSTSAESPRAGTTVTSSGKLVATRPRTSSGSSGGGARGSECLQADPDAGSGAEDG
ncbi:hypothetical protein EI94DRAFT_1747313 [Lactarius quietus]|nr:hypothetical protein EI94DRAFT_1747313 [Lactarius quietus]